MHTYYSSIPIPVPVLNIDPEYSAISAFVNWTMSEVMIVPLLDAMYSGNDGIVAVPEFHTISSMLEGMYWYHRVVGVPCGVMYCVSPFLLA